MACLLSARRGDALIERVPPAPEPVAPPAATVADHAAASHLQSAASGSAHQGGGARRFVRDVGGDYRHFFSRDTARWLGAGGGQAFGVYAADESFRRALQTPSGPTTTLTAGQEYGGALVQFPLAASWWVVGLAIGSERGAAAGRDLVRGQISATSWTYAVKYASQRTRPNGNPRSFPSGHASSTFATAVVLQQHYGWKLGIPAFAAASYTAASRVTGNMHWASDVVFGAFLGATSGRTVTVRLRENRLSLAPLVVPAGGGIVVNILR
jgi:hypothetical protein